jgi:hypothetical protein
MDLVNGLHQDRAERVAMNIILEDGDVRVGKVMA